MTSIPFGMHAAQKVRANMNLSSGIASNSKNGNKWQKEQNPSYSFSSDQYSEVAPSKYCDKMMNSIWGLYNRYSVHNFKSSTSSAFTFPVGQQSSSQKSQDCLPKPVKCPLDGMQFKLNLKNFHQ